MRIEFLLFILFFSQFSYTQNQNNMWYFGWGAGLDFSNGSPVAISGSTMADEGTATMCAPTGALLFYTDGVTVWDQNHNPMPNGTGLLGGPSSTQSSLIVPVPDQCNKYIIFTTQDETQNAEFRYSEVDMTLNGGFGDVVANTKNTLLYSNISEQQVAVRHANQKDYWVVVHTFNSPNYVSFLVTSAGINTTPVISTGTASVPRLYLVGSMAAAPDGSKLVYTSTYGQICEKVNFDNNTGIVSNPVNLVAQFSIPGDIYGAEFSPNSNLLYTSTAWLGYTVHQVDLVGNTATLLYTDFGTYPLNQMRLGPDNKIYVAKLNKNFLDVILNPNISGVGCNYTPAGVSLASGTKCRLGLPNVTPINPFDSIRSTNILGPDTSICPGSNVVLSVNINNSSYLWNDGSTNNSLLVTNPGTYWIEVNHNGCFIYDTIVVDNFIDSLDLGPDQAICNGVPVVLTTNYSNATSYLWSTGETSPSITIDAIGTYSVDVIDMGCFMQDTINFTEITFLNSLGNDTTVCPGEYVFFNASTTPADYSWSNGSNTASIFTNVPGIYWLDITLNGCTKRDSVLVSHFVLDHLNLGPDQVLCGDTASVVLTSNLSGQAYLWNTGANTPSITAHPDSTFILQIVDMNNCKINDTISIEHSTPNVFLGKDIVSCVGENYILNVEKENLVGYHWSTGQTKPLININQEGNYWVIVEDIYGCIASDTIHYDFLSCSLYIPNAFTPNDDNLNDIFKAEGENIIQYELIIFNRWGEPFFQTTQLNLGWDGTYHGIDSPMGVYSYKLTYRDGIRKELIEKYGHFSLIR